eukprot:993618-Prymnesium_polylepis.2
MARERGASAGGAAGALSSRGQGGLPRRACPGTGLHGVSCNRMVCTSEDGVSCFVLTPLLRYSHLRRVGGDGRAIARDRPRITVTSLHRPCRNLSAILLAPLSQM